MNLRGFASRGRKFRLDGVRNVPLCVGEYLTRFPVVATYAYVLLL